MTASDKAPTAPICLNTAPAHISHMKAVTPACRLESMTIEDEAHAIINDPLEAPMTPGPGNREYRTPDHVKATDRALDAYDRQLFAFHRQVWNLSAAEDLIYLNARDILIGRLHAEALQDDFVRDLNANRAAAMTKLHRAHTEAQREQAYLVVKWLREVCVGREKWAEGVITLANLTGHGDLSSALVSEIERARRQAQYEDRQHNAFRRFVARLV